MDLSRTSRSKTPRLVDEQKERNDRKIIKRKSDEECEVVAILSKYCIIMRSSLVYLLHFLNLHNISLFKHRGLLEWNFFFKFRIAFWELSFSS